MTETRLLVPIVQATQWVDWLEESLGRAAEKAGVGFDGGEEEGPFEVYAFDNITVNDLAKLATEALQPAGKIKAVVTGDAEVTVEVTTKGWMQPLGPVEHPYDRAIKKLCKIVSDDLEWQKWWASTGHSQFLLQQQNGEGEVAFFPDEDDPKALLGAAALDISILNPEKPGRAEVKAAAERNMTIVVAALAEHVGSPHPPLPW